MSKVRKIVVSGLMLALCIVLPFVTGHIPQVGSMLCPMHIPVMLCGFICGWKYGLCVGFVAPLLRFALFGMPPAPGCIAMAFELAAYGTATGLLFSIFPKKAIYIYISLICSMIIGRLVWGAAEFVILGISGTRLTLSTFLSSCVVLGLPGIILQLILVPIIVLALKKAKLLAYGE